MDILKKNKVKLIKWLRVDMIIIQHAQSNSLITDDEYKRLGDISDESKKITDLLDLMLAKGDSTCQNFLKMLKEDDVNECSPELRIWINSVSTSVTANAPGLPSHNTARSTDNDTSLHGIDLIKDYQGFLRKNRSALIDKVKNIDRIVDDLILSDEMAAIVRVQDTDQAKMRKVLEFTNSKKAAEELLKALFTHRKDVMEDVMVC